MAISTKAKPRQGWRPHPRKGSEYWSGLGAAKGWCIYSRCDGYRLQETGAYTSGPLKDMVVTKAGTVPVKRFGPFDSFEAAKAAAVIMCDIDIGDSK